MKTHRIYKSQDIQRIIHLQNAQLIRVSSAHKFNYEADNACDSIGRLMEQSGNGMARRMAGRRAQKCSRSYGRQPALIPVVRYNSRFIVYSNAKAYTYTNILAVGFHLPLSRFGFLSIHIPIFIYLQ